MEYLLARGADVNEMILTSRIIPPESVGSALHKAVEYDQSSVLDMLLSAGANTTLKDGKDRTARDIAVEKGLDANVLAMLSES